MSARVLKRTVLDESAEEALLTIGDGRYFCEAYCQPCSAQVGDALTRPLIAFDTAGIERQPADSVIGFGKGPPPFGSLVCGEVTNRRYRLVRVGDIQVKLDVPLPSDVVEGELVSFSSSRLDFTS
jgi:hypothetical protein